MIEVRSLPPDDLERLSEIDRSEHVDTLYEVHDGALTSRAVDFDAPRWGREGDGPHTVRGFVNDLRPILERGATLLAAFEGEALAGVAIVEPRFEGAMAWLAFLHVSREFRRQGVGTALWNAAVERARAAGARTMYVSSTPTGSAVGFYLAHGCEVLAAPHAELFAQEPEDVHLRVRIA